MGCRQPSSPIPRAAVRTLFIVAHFALSSPASEGADWRQRAEKDSKLHDAVRNNNAEAASAELNKGEQDCNLQVDSQSTMCSRAARGQISGIIMACCWCSMLLTYCWWGGWPAATGLRREGKVPEGGGQQFRGLHVSQTAARPSHLLIGFCFTMPVLR